MSLPQKNAAYSLPSWKEKFAHVDYIGNVRAMVIARSKITARGQTVVPAEIRRKLGLQAGTVLEWHEEGERVVVSRAGRYTFEDIHRASFPQNSPDARTIEAIKAGLRRYVKGRHGRH